MLTSFKFGAVKILAFFALIPFIFISAAKADYKKIGGYVSSGINFDSLKVNLKSNLLKEDLKIKGRYFGVNFGAGYSFFWNNFSNNIRFYRWYIYTVSKMDS
jgi:hypothetical protein